MNVLTLAPATSSWDVVGPDGRRGRDESAPFLDLVVDGVSLRRRFGLHEQQTVLQRRSWAPPSEDVEASVRRLCGFDVPPPSFASSAGPRAGRLFRRPRPPTAPWATAFEDGRVTLSYCPCGDLDCGALSTRVEVGEREVRWCEVAVQVTYESVDLEEQLTLSFTFARDAYEGVMTPLLERDWRLPVA